jgi:cytochrome P450 family 628
MITIYIQDNITRIPITEIQCHLLQQKMNSMDINTKILEGGTAQLAAVAVGILAHLFVFRIGEWDLATTSLIVSFFGFQLVSAAALSNLASDHVSLFDAQIIVSRLAFLALGGIFSSMVVYRAFFHRLCKFPGPFWARISNLYVTSLSAKKLHLYAEVQELHRQYGDIVRLGEHAIRKLLGI